MLDMEGKKDVSIMEVIKWEESQPDGFRGILKNPRGEDGFLSKEGGALTWTPIGEGQDPVEVMKAAKALHDVIHVQGCMDAEILGYLGSEVERLSKPKPKA